MKKLFYLNAITFLTILLSSCGKGGGTTPPPDACAGLSFKFSADVQPIINSTCSTTSGGCHGAGSSNSGGALTDYNKIFLKRLDIHFQVSNGLMPKSGSLTADQKNKIICWINSGAPNN
jgi:hypothetical protein